MIGQQVACRVGHEQRTSAQLAGNLIVVLPPQALGVAVRQCIADAGIEAGQVVSLCLDTTCCTVVALDEGGHALRPALLWMDMRSAQQAARVAASGDEALQVNGGGAGPVSSEWMVPKALWIKENEPQVFSRAAHICEYQV